MVPIDDTGWHAPPARINPLVRKLNKLVTLAHDEERALESVSRNRKKFAAEQTLVEEGRRPCFVFLIMEGVAFRYKYLANGKRQIFGYLLPGDLCDAQYVFCDQSDHDVGLLTDAEVAMIPARDLMAVMESYPNVRQALLKSMLVDAAMLREWLLNVGQRKAVEKLAHFICEMSERLHGLSDGDTGGPYFIPLTQLELADTMGLTTVHVSRCMQHFRRHGLVAWSRRHLIILDHARLKQIAGFDQTYLHLGAVRQSRGCLPQ